MADEKRILRPYVAAFNFLDDTVERKIRKFRGRPLDARNTFIGIALNAYLGDAPIIGAGIKIICLRDEKVCIDSGGNFLHHEWLRDIILSINLTVSEATVSLEYWSQNAKKSNNEFLDFMCFGQASYLVHDDIEANMPMRPGSDDNIWADERALLCTVFTGPQKSGHEKLELVDRMHEPWQYMSIFFSDLASVTVKEPVYTTINLEE